VKLHQHKLGHQSVFEKSMQQHFKNFIFFRSRPGVFVVSGVTANGPIGPMTEVNSDLNYYGSDGRGNLLVTQDQQQFYVVNQTGQDQRTILVPIRTPTPPPSYTSIFGGDQQQNQAQLAPPFQ
jgi:hypothetical protein